MPFSFVKRPTMHDGSSYHRDRLNRIRLEECTAETASSRTPAARRHHVEPLDGTCILRSPMHRTTWCGDGHVDVCVHFCALLGESFAEVKSRINSDGRKDLVAEAWSSRHSISHFRAPWTSSQPPHACDLRGADPGRSCTLPKGAAGRHVRQLKALRATKTRIKCSAWHQVPTATPSERPTTAPCGMRERKVTMPPLPGLNMLTTGSSCPRSRPGSPDLDRRTCPRKSCMPTNRKCFHGNQGERNTRL